MNRQLTVHNAEIQTATVEVRTLTISGKQVTLAVFRQLIHERIVTDGGEFRGTPWGTVNYHPDKCSDDPEHLHVVWQLGAELRRARAAPPLRSDDFVGVNDKRISAYLDLLLTQGDLAGTRVGSTQRYLKLSSAVFGKIVFDVDEDQASALGAYDALSDTYRRRATEAIKARGSVFDGRAADEIAGAVRRERERRGRCQDRWAEIKALPQLFIAV